MHIYLLAFDVATWNECYASPEKKKFDKVNRKKNKKWFDWLINYMIYRRMKQSILIGLQK